MHIESQGGEVYPAGRFAPANTVAWSRIGHPARPLNPLLRQTSLDNNVALTDNDNLRAPDRPIYR